MSQVRPEEGVGEATISLRRPHHSQHSRLARLKGDLTGAFTATVLTLPGAMSLGILAFAALGPGYAGAGILAAMMTAVVANVAATLFPAVRCQVLGSRASTTALIGAFVAMLAAHPEMQSAGGVDTARVFALVAVAVMASGLLQAGFGLAGIGHAVKFVPYPVVAGFMNGIALMILASQLRPAVGLEGTAPFGTTLAELAQAHVSSVVVATTAFAGLFLAEKHPTRVPAVVIGLASGIAMHYLLAAVWPASAGAVVGITPTGGIPVPSPVGVWHAVTGSSGSLLLEVVLPAAILLAAVSAIEGLLSAVVADSVTRGRHDGSRALASQGMANVAAGFFGALPAAGYMQTPIASFRAGARTPLSTLFHALFVLLVLLILGPFVAKVPLAALAGLMIFFAVTMIDRWSRDLLWRVGGGKHGRVEMGLNVLIVVGVAAAQAMLNVVWALAIGVVASVALLLVKLSRSPVRRHLDGTLRSSLRVRGDEAREALRTAAARIRILELEGELFFGTADRLQREVDALPGDASIVILDLRRVNEIDATGARVLDVLNERAAQRGMTVALSHVGRGDRRGDYLRGIGLEQAIAPHLWFADLDRALEWAEDQVLGTLKLVEASEEVPPGRMAVLRDLDEDDLRKVAQVLERHELTAGDAVFREGEEGERMYFIARGRVSIGVGVEGQGRDVRLATFSPGVVFGEMSLIQGERRSADAYASAESVVLYSLSRGALEQLARTDPELGMRIYRNISRELAARLRTTTRALRLLD